MPRSKQKPSEEKKKDDRPPAEIRAEKFRTQGNRETVEAFVVAFILALLFRAFLAEAFVIPTGSMAPTLMGAHKDVFCDRCNQRFQFGASSERREPTTSKVVVAGVCPNCRHVNSLDLADEWNDATFNGDRILVSKYAYAFSDPERWDVIVFKFPGNPKQNYIKRLVGLPNETLTIRHGDVYTRPTGSDQRDEILRKPESKMLAMRQLVYDTDQQSTSLIQANYPSRWQPWQPGATSPPSGSWQVKRSEDGLTASLAAKDSAQTRWLRYYHRWPDESQWDMASKGGSLEDVDPYSSRAITDFYAYDSYVNVPARQVYEEPPSAFQATRFERMLNGGYSFGTLREDYRPDLGPGQYRGAMWGGHDFGARQGVGKDGVHWVGDLMIEADVEANKDVKSVMFEIVEAGVQYRCQFNFATGQATMTIEGEMQYAFDGGKLEAVAETSVRAGGRHEIRFSNFDDQLLLWVDGDLVTFASPTTFDGSLVRNPTENRPYFLPQHPLDAAPVGIAAQGGECVVHRMKIDRDKYYISVRNTALGIHDYDNAGSLVTIQRFLSNPELWDSFAGWNARRSTTFELEEDQFFPMGDNSPESLDARCWARSKARLNLPDGVNKDAWTWWDKSYVPRELLVGKAILVFWPHSWNAPVPFMPNLNRIKLIR